MGQLYSKDLEILNNFPKGSMKEFSHRKMEVYRSIDQVSTGTYFNYPDKTPGYLELVVFDYSQKSPNLFLRWINSNFYIPIIGGFGSTRGIIAEGGGRNVLQEMVSPSNKYFPEEKPKMQYLTINKTDKHLFLQFGYNEGEFNFMERVAAINMMAYDKFVPSGGNDEICNSVFSAEYVKIPDFRRIEYAFKDGDNILIADASTHNYQYEDIKFTHGNFTTGFKKGTVKDFERYRDGGTTNAKLLFGETIIEFHSPTPLKPDESATFDKRPLVKIPKEEIPDIAEKLGIFMEPQLMSIDEQMRKRYS